LYTGDRETPLNFLSRLGAVYNYQTFSKLEICSYSNGLLVYVLRIVYDRLDSFLLQLVFHCLRGLPFPEYAMLFLSSDLIDNGG